MERTNRAQVHEASPTMWLLSGHRWVEWIRVSAQEVRSWAADAPLEVTAPRGPDAVEGSHPRAPPGTSHAEGRGEAEGQGLVSWIGAPIRLRPAPALSQVPRSFRME